MEVNLQGLLDIFEYTEVSVCHQMQEGWLFVPGGKRYKIERVKHTKANIISRKKEGLFLSHLTMLSFKLLMFFPTAECSGLFRSGMEMSSS